MLLKAALLLGVIATPVDERLVRYYPDRGAVARYGRGRKATATTVAYCWQGLFFAKAIGVAVAHPGNALPSATPPGNAGLALLFGILAVEVPLTLWQAHAARRLVSRQAELFVSLYADAHDSAAAPLLGAAAADGSDGSKRGYAAAANGGAGSGAAGAKKGRKEAQRTVLELIKLSLPDWPLLVLAFAAGSVAALFQACIPYYTGQTIDYASIEPDRCAACHVHLIKATSRCWLLCKYQLDGWC